MHSHHTPSNRDGPAKRPPFWANRLARLLTRAAVAQEIGPESCYLILVVAFTEDVRRYDGPVTFWNEQLMGICGLASRRRLVAARDRAIEAGWLEYKPGSKSRPGLYRTKLPPQFTDWADKPADESDIFRSETERQATPPDDIPLQNETESGRNVCQKADGMCAPFLPVPLPTPLPKKSAPSARAALPREDLLLELIDGWNSLGKGIVKNGVQRDPIAKEIISGWKRVQKDPAVREAFSDIPRLLAAMKRAKFTHGNGAFTLPNMFGKNKAGEWKVIKLLNGDYDDVRSASAKRNGRATGAGVKYDPDAAAEFGKGLLD